MYPKRKICTACGYKTDKNGKQSRKKTLQVIIVTIVIYISVKIVLKNFVHIVKYNILLLKINDEKK